LTQFRNFVSSQKHTHNKKKITTAEQREASLVLEARVLLNFVLLVVTTNFQQVALRMRKKQ